MWTFRPFLIFTHDLTSRVDKAMCQFRLTRASIAGPDIMCASNPLETYMSALLEDL